MGKNMRLNQGHPFQPTDEHRRQILTMAGFGIPHDEMANMIEISVPTMRKYFQRELDTGATVANTRVAQALYTNAVKHNSVAAQIWWTKSRMGWKETNDLNIGGTNPLMLHLIAAQESGRSILNGTIEGHISPDTQGDGVETKVLDQTLPSE